MAEHNDLGLKGEQYAAKYLKKNNYSILDRNWRAGHLEIDIVASKDDFIVFVEVKTRTNEKFYDAAIAVNRLKQKQIIRAANCYIQKNDIKREARFDIISVFVNGDHFKLDHLEDAFYPTLR